MAPETKLHVVEAAVAALPRAFRSPWESLKQDYRIPSWFVGAKFGLFMHWGLYAVPAHHNECYEMHMYAAERA